MTKKKKPAATVAQAKTKKPRKRKRRVDIDETLLARLQAQGPPIAPSFATLCTYKDPGHRSKKRRFLIAFAASAGSLSRASQAAGVHRTSHYDWLHDDPKYLKAFKALQREAATVLEDEARRRAFEGTLKAVYYQGRLVDYEVEYSDALLTQLLRANHPRHRPMANLTVKGTGKDGALPVHLVQQSAALAKLPEEDLLARIRVLRDALDYCATPPESAGGTR